MQLNDATEVERLLAARDHGAAAVKLDIALAARADDTLALLLHANWNLPANETIAHVSSWSERSDRSWTARKLQSNYLVSSLT